MIGRSLVIQCRAARRGFASMTAASATGGEGRKPSSAGGSGSGSSSDGQGSSLEGGSAASPPSSASFPPRQQLMALLPPLPLYRRLLRAHRRHLPPDMRLLGDEYIRSEFRSHREVENPVHIVSSIEFGPSGQHHCLRIGQRPLTPTCADRFLDRVATLRTEDRR